MKVSFVHAQTGNVRHSMPIKSAYRKSGPYPGLWGSSGNPIGGVRGNVDHPPPLPTFWWVGSNPLTRPFPGCQVSGQNFSCRCATGTHAHLLCSSRPSHVFFFQKPAHVNIFFLAKKKGNKGCHFGGGMIRKLGKLTLRCCKLRVGERQGIK